MTATNPDGLSEQATVGAGLARPMLGAVAACWALLLGMGLVMLGNGLQGSLLGVRAMLEGFPTTTTGFVMSGYFAGFAAGSTLAPRMVARVGHIRVFAALASLASVVALLHVVVLSPGSWAAMRVVTGFCYAGIYVVAESWLNDRVTNALRGQLLSIYMVVGLTGMAAGPLLLNAADPGGFLLFVAVSILISLALIPILLTASPAPRFDVTAKISLRQLYRMSPLGVLGSTATGLSNGALVGMGAVYAENAGLSLAEISFFMSAAVLGGVVLQWPVGHLSDRFDRRVVLTVITLLAALAAGTAVATTGRSVPGLVVLVGLFGALSFPMYSLSLAHTNDHLEPAQMVGASSSLVLVTGAGATLGPIGAAFFMTGLGTGGFFWFLALVHAALGGFALYRMTRRAATPAEQQGPHIYVPRTSPVAVAIAMESAQEQTRDD